MSSYITLLSTWQSCGKQLLLADFGWLRDSVFVISVPHSSYGRTNQNSLSLACWMVHQAYQHRDIRAVLLQALGSLLSPAEGWSHMNGWTYVWHQSNRTELPRPKLCQKNICWNHLLFMSFPYLTRRYFWNIFLLNHFCGLCFWWLCLLISKCRSIFPVIPTARASEPRNPRAWRIQLVALKSECFGTVGQKDLLGAL